MELARGLSAVALRAVADLEREVVAADGGRLKLDPAALRGRTGERVEDLLWWQDGRLVGFLGLYAHGSPLELAGMVAPDARGRGIGGALLDQALALVRERAPQPPLLVVPRPSAAGRTLALRRGGALDHSEHALVLRGDPGPSRRDDVDLRLAEPADAAVVSRLLAAGFGGPPPADLVDQLASRQEPTLLVLRDGAPVGTLRVHRDGDGADVYGFVVDPAEQGRGIGREVLLRVCRQLREQGVQRIGLEVAVDNERALGLYTSLGFAPVAVEDYYAVPTG